MQIFGKKVFAFVNLKQFVSDEDLQEIYKFFRYEKLHLLLFEGYQKDTLKNEHILIIDKESGVNSEAVFAALSREGEYYFIHRLDRNTRGLMAFAKTREAERELFAAFKNHTLKKVYHAVCFRVPSEPQSVLTAYLKKDENKAAVKVFSKPTAGAEKIVTEYKILESAADTAKLEIVLHTGKTHQIRAHLAFIGCPIAGDMKYGDSKANKDKKLSRQLLVAKKLQFAFAGTLSYLNEKIFVSQFELTL